MPALRHSYGVSYTYDDLGHRVAVTNALGDVTWTEYDVEGRVVRTYGATYPVEYDYDAFGRMTAMRTFRDEQGAGDETRWLYDAPTGLLTNKVYADGKGTSYTYTPDGQLASRTWARGVTTTYTYTNGSSLAAIDYSDDTPDVFFAYDRLGRMTSAIVAGVSTNTFTYDGIDLVSETQNGVEIVRATDALGRPSGFSLGPDYSVQYGYDAYGRFHSVTSSIASITSAFTYSYLDDSDLLAGMTSSSGFLWERAYESARSLITSVENRYSETVISRYDYENDELGRRTSRADSGLAFANPAFDAYSYNDRSEVTGAQRYHGTDVSDRSTVYGGREFGYAYDPIGNRTSASETIGGGTLAKAYSANALNQYTAIDNPEAVGLRGDATNTAVVTVNGEAVQGDDITSDTIPWHFALEADNADGPDFPFAEIVAVVNPPDTNTPALVSTAGGHVYAPPQSETLTYDLDGNLLSDGRWQYTWNGENRLIKAEELVSPTNRQPYVVEYAYDHRGRMVWKTVAATNALPSKTIRYLWDDYNIIVETVVSDTGTNIAYNVWGLDLSSSLQGAGGVGGLLAVVKDGEAYTPAFDANGNVTEYLSADGAIAAHYEYSPFGEIVVQSGDLADSFTHRFSTKPWCPVTGLSEYEFRKYSPYMGRWLSRDPVFDLQQGCEYGFVGSNPTDMVDNLGLYPLWDWNQFLNWLLNTPDEAEHVDWEYFDPHGSASQGLINTWMANNKESLCNACKNAPVGESGIIGLAGGTKAVVDQKHYSREHPWINVWSGSADIAKGGIQIRKDRETCKCEFEFGLNLEATDTGDFNDTDQRFFFDLIPDRFMKRVIHDRLRIGGDYQMWGRSYENVVRDLECE